MDLVQGTLDVLILSIVAIEPLHGLAISERLVEILRCAASQPPALHKLEHLQAFTSEPAVDCRRLSTLPAVLRLGSRMPPGEQEGSWPTMPRRSTRLTQQRASLDPMTRLRTTLAA